MKALIISGMDNETIISVEINESFLYHLHIGIQNTNELKTKMEGYPILNIENSGFIRYSTYKLRKVFSQELEEGNTKLPEDGIEYLLVDQNENIVFTEDQNIFLNWKVIEYSFDYYDDPIYDKYFKNLEQVETTFENCRIIIEDGSFFINLYDMPAFIDDLLGNEINYTDFEKEIKEEINLNYKPIKKKYFYQNKE
ncbi:hypothetical protein SAMN04488062_102262 [Flavobacterium omnivorum]|uniref:Uncharacterized protein n=1 Tax=Flavobacterium omnivorum TaxID=178355 RepID=A0A1G7XCS0_9FLAO|nr:hypothetical protein [Flavobacterium omnivorum]SDG82075.1 hypothetical protein SAMN04488062_102262 [Flavobacterium omnivorum]